MTPIPRDAPRCLKCGVRLPLHVAGCPELPKRDEHRDELPGKDAREVVEVVERSRFDAFPWGEEES